MNAFTQANIASAQKRLDNALAHLEDYADGKGNPITFGQAYAELLRAKGDLHSAVRLEEMVEEETLIERVRRVGGA